MTHGSQSNSHVLQELSLSLVLLVRYIQVWLSCQYSANASAQHKEKKQPATLGPFIPISYKMSF